MITDKSRKYILCFIVQFFYEVVEELLKTAGCVFFIVQRKMSYGYLIVGENQMTFFQ